MQIPLINEHLFCKYFVRLSVGNATKGFATYGCFHPCLLNENINSIYLGGGYGYGHPAPHHVGPAPHHAGIIHPVKV